MSPVAPKPDGALGADRMTCVILTPRDFTQCPWGWAHRHTDHQAQVGIASQVPHHLLKVASMHAGVAWEAGHTFTILPSPGLGQVGESTFPKLSPAFPRSVFSHKPTFQSAHPTVVTAHLLGEPLKATGL